MPKKISKTQINPMNRVLTENKNQPKSKKEINNSYYQNNKEKLRLKRRIKYEQDKEREKDYQKERYHQQKEQAQLAAQQTNAKYYGAEAIKILMTFKEYTELNKEKHKLYADFCWTLKDCQGINDIVLIMKLAQVADNLIRDYQETAKNEIKKGKSWNNYDYDQQQRLIRYWGYEKARIESGYTDTAEQLEKQSQTHLKEIELAKYHEEKGKKNCECYACEEQKKIRNEVKTEREQTLADYEKAEQTKFKQEEKAEKEKRVKGWCTGCYELRVLSEDGYCEKCEEESDIV